MRKSLRKTGLSSLIQAVLLAGLALAGLKSHARAAEGATEAHSDLPHFALVGAKVVTIARGVFEGGVVLVAQGKIE